MDFDLSFYRGKKVLVTGHTGFKGTWLCRELLQAGAEVTGYALEPPTEPSIFALTGTGKEMESIVGDVRDLPHVHETFRRVQPEIVIHMAAQPLVRESYRDPIWTYETNVMGTVNMLECAKQAPSVRSFVNVTTDKVYRNPETGAAMTETDVLDGFDPYSNSKSCSELVTATYVRSFFSCPGEGGAEDPFHGHYRKDGFPIAVSTVRAGNVIGGGDFAQDRIIPDCVRAALAGEEIVLRNPDSVRPYQHVLEPLNVYLKLAALQYEDPSYAGSYNVGPDDGDCLTTRELAGLFCDSWNGLNPGKEPLRCVSRSDGGPHEAGLLRLNCDKLKKVLGWKPVWTMAQTM
nr:CDP-glucose 4,6-dehydratase [Lachnospiraceae bacterium]